MFFVTTLILYHIVMGFASLELDLYCYVFYVGARTCNVMF